MGRMGGSSGVQGNQRNTLDDKNLTTDERCTTRKETSASKRTTQKSLLDCFSPIELEKVCRPPRSKHTLQNSFVDGPPVQFEPTSRKGPWREDYLTCPIEAHKKAALLDASNLVEYSSDVKKLLKKGRPKLNDVPEKFDQKDAPSLLQMARDGHLLTRTGKSKKKWGPIHAARALSALGEGAQLVTLLDCNDEWYLAELPKLIASAGIPAFQPSIVYLRDATKWMKGRIGAVLVVDEIVKFHTTKDKTPIYTALATFRDLLFSPSTQASLAATILCTSVADTLLASCLRFYRDKGAETMYWRQDRENWVDSHFSPCYLCSFVKDAGEEVDKSVDKAMVVGKGMELAPVLSKEGTRQKFITEYLNEYGSGKNFAGKDSTFAGKVRSPNLFTVGSCTHCNQLVCSKCAEHCVVCAEMFCHLCFTLDYGSNLVGAVCFDCAEVKGTPGWKRPPSLLGASQGGARVTREVHKAGHHAGVNGNGVQGHKDNGTFAKGVKSAASGSTAGRGNEHGQSGGEARPKHGATGKFESAKKLDEDLIENVGQLGPAVPGSNLGHSQAGKQWASDQWEPYEQQREVPRSEYPSFKPAGKGKKGRGEVTVTDEQAAQTSICKRAEEFKDKGNKAFKEGQFEAAVNHYVEAARLLDLKRDLFGPSQKFKKLRGSIFLNMAAAQLKLEQYQSVVNNCNQAIKMFDEGNAEKAYFRRGLAYAKMGKLSLAHADIHKAQRMLPHDKVVQAELDSVTEALAAELEATSKAKQPGNKKGKGKQLAADLETGKDGKPKGTDERRNSGSSSVPLEADGVPAASASHASREKLKAAEKQKKSEKAKKKMQKAEREAEQKAKLAEKMRLEKLQQQKEAEEYQRALEQRRKELEEQELRDAAEKIRLREAEEERAKEALAQAEEARRLAKEQKLAELKARVQATAGGAPEIVNGNNTSIPAGMQGYGQVNSFSHPQGMPKQVFPFGVPYMGAPHVTQPGMAQGMSSASSNWPSLPTAVTPTQHSGSSWPGGGPTTSTPQSSRSVKDLFPYLFPEAYSPTSAPPPAGPAIAAHREQFSSHGVPASAAHQQTWPAPSWPQAGQAWELPGGSRGYVEQGAAWYAGSGGAAMSHFNSGGLPSNETSTLNDLDESVEEAAEGSNVEDTSCAICMEAERDALVQPCSHLSTCTLCIKRIKESTSPFCPICRGPILEIVKVNLE